MNETLVVPVKDGMTVKVGSVVVFKELSSLQLMDMGLRFLDVARERMREDSDAR